MDNTLEKEVQRYHQEKNSAVLAKLSALQADIHFLRTRLETMENDLQQGKVKEYYVEIIEEMRKELAEKEAEHGSLAELVGSFNIPESFYQSLKYDIQTLIRLLDDEPTPPHLLNQLVSKFVKKIFIQRETNLLHLTIQLAAGGSTLLERTIVAQY